MHEIAREASRRLLAEDVLELGIKVRLDDQTIDLVQRAVDGLAVAVLDCTVGPVNRRPHLAAWQWGPPIGPAADAAQDEARALADALRAARMRAGRSRPPGRRPGFAS